MRWNQTPELAKITILAFACISQSILALPRIVIGQSAITEVLVEGQFAAQTTDGDYLLVVTVKNLGKETFIFSDDRIASGIKAKLVFSDGAQSEFDAFAVSSFKLNVLGPFGEFTRQIRIPNVIAKTSDRSWKNAEVIQLHWEPSKLFRVTEEAVKEAESKSMDLLVYADQKGSLLKIATPVISVTKTHGENVGHRTQLKNSPSSVQTPALKTAPEAKPMTSSTSEEPTSSTLWSIIVVLILAAGGLLWLLLKRRS